MKARLPQGTKSAPAGNPDMSSMVRKAKKMQDDIKRVQDQIGEEEFEQVAGDGRVTVKMSGSRQLKSVKFSDDAIEEIKKNPAETLEELEDLIIAAVNTVLEDIENETTTRIEDVTDGISLPGLI